MKRHTMEVAVGRLRRAGEAGGPSAHAAILDAVSLVAGFDCAAVMTTDPETILPSGGIFTGLNTNVCGPFWGCEARESELLRFVDLIRSRTAVASLAQRVPGAFEKSDRYREVYAALALGDELRVVFMSGDACLGMAAFLRADRGRAFSQEELKAVRQLTAPVADLLRREALTSMSDERVSGPVVALVGAEGEILGRTPGAEEILADLRAGAVGSGELPPTLIAPLARLRARSGTRAVTTRVRGTSGRWYRLHAAPVEEQPGVHALSLERARSADLASILLRSYGLTAREREVVSSLSRGLAAKDISAELTISVHTVRDHVKSIYRKMGVGSLGELQARLFSSQGIGSTR